MNSSTKGLTVLTLLITVGVLAASLWGEIGWSHIRLLAMVFCFMMALRVSQEPER